VLKQGAYRSWKVTEFKIQIFQTWKVVELGLGPGKSWKINQVVAAFPPVYMFLAFTYIIIVYCQTRFSLESLVKPLSVFCTHAVIWYLCDKYDTCVTISDWVLWMLLGRLHALVCTEYVFVFSAFCYIVEICS